MPYSYQNKKGQTYYLHGKEVTLQGGRKQRIHFFAREVKPGVLDAVPEGHNVVENERTGLPFLKRGDGAATASAAGASDTATTATAGRAGGRSGSRAKK